MSETATESTAPVTEAVEEVKEEIVAVTEAKGDGWKEEVEALRAEIAELKKNAAKPAPKPRTVSPPTPVADKKKTEKQEESGETVVKPKRSYGARRWFGDE